MSHFGSRIFAISKFIRSFGPMEGTTMKKLPWLVALTVFALAPSATLPQSMMSPSLTQGVGPHGYDFLIGTWSCVNSMPATPMSGPSNTTATFSRSGQGTAIFVRVSGKNFDAAGYVAYAV